MSQTTGSNDVTMDSTTTSSSTTTTPDSHYPYTVIPFGIESGWPFDLVHSIGLTSLVLSVTSCIVTLTMIFKANPAANKNVFARPIGERLVIYLAVCNLLYCFSHTMDHSYMFAVRGNPPEKACAAFAFFLNEFVVAQSLVVTFTAVNAFVMVVKEKRIPLGKYDWGLALYALGIPLCVGIVGLSTRHFGPSGMWCYMDHRTKAGEILTNVVGIVMLVTFVFNVACYSAVWLKIRQAAQKMNQSGSSGGSKYTRTARTMMLFVAVYLAQWWSYVTFAVWLLINEPHIVIRVMTVCFSNMGGAFNLMTYLMMIRQKKGSSKVETVKETQTAGGAVRKAGATSDKVGLVKPNTTRTTESSSA